MLMNVKRRLPPLLLLLFLASLFPVSATPRIGIRTEQGFPEADDLARGVALAEAIYGDDFQAGENLSDADYTLLLRGFPDDDYLVVTAELSSPGGESLFSKTAQLYEEKENSSYYKDLLFLSFASLDDYFSEMVGEGPVTVAELDTTHISAGVGPGSAGFMPFSLASAPGGELILTFGSFAARLDDTLRLGGFPGLELYREGNYSAAYGASVSPGGTLYLRPGAGKEIYRIAPGETRPRRLRSPITTTGPFVALGDGGVVVTDITSRRAVKLSLDGAENLDIFGGPYGYIQAAAAGPEGNLWIYDPLERRVRIYDPDGILIGSIAPAVSPEESFAPASLAVLPDGSWIAAENGNLWKFDRRGFPLWRSSRLNGAEDGSLPLNPSVAVAPASGRIFLTDQLGKRVYLLLDPDLPADDGLNLLLKENVSERRRNPQASAPWREQAQILEDEGAFELARAAWERILDLDPRDSLALRRSEELEAAALYRSAREQREQVLELLERLGPESARAAYSQAVQLYERLVALAPAHPSASAELTELKELFQRREGGGPGPDAPLLVVSAEVENLFPGLLGRYREDPVGRVRILNRGEETLFDIEAELMLKQYMDFPRSGAVVASLAPGEELELPLFVGLNQRIFELEEDLPLSARLTIRGRSAGGDPVEISSGTELVLHRRSALTWDETAKLAAFITPREATIERYAAGLVRGYREVPGLSTALGRAAAVVSGLGKEEILYVEDPDSPITDVLGSAAVVDTVRFPRSTLRVRSGDCDDTTALTASLLEAVGISTAIMTSPGHVFLAVRLDDPPENRWLYETEERRVVLHRGGLWLPLESTTLSQGFLASWEYASRLVAAGGSELLPTAEAWRRYPPLPLPATLFEQLPPAGTDSWSELSRLREELLQSGVRYWEERYVGADGTALISRQNRIGALYGRFGELGLAEGIFTELVERHPEYLPGRINLANVLLLRERPEAARDLLLAAGDDKPTPLVLLTLARCYHALSRTDEARGYYDRARAENPELAAAYAFLGGRDNGERAGGGEAPAAWAF